MISTRIVATKLKQLAYGALCLLLCALVIIPTRSVYAYTADDFKSIAGQSWWYDANACSTESTTTSAATPVVNGNNATQISIVKTIIGIAKTQNLGQAGALIGLMVGLDESNLRILANPNVPVSESNPAKQGDGQDHNSVGVFQQQPDQDWSTIASGTAALSNQAAVYQLMDPAYSAEAFFGGAKGTPSALSKGLQNISGWQSLDPGVAANSVQRSGDPTGGNYNRQRSAAQSFIDQYYAAAPAVPLPVPLTGNATSPTSTSTSSTSNTCESGSPVSSGTGSCTPQSTSAPATAISAAQVRLNVVACARAELALWTSGTLKPSTNAYFKYTQNTNEQWCADFTSWIYLQAGYAITGDSKNWRLAGVPSILAIGQNKSHGFTYSQTPQPGDLAIQPGFDNNGNPVSDGHINIVESVNGSNVTFIGGDQPQKDRSISGFRNYIVSEYSSSKNSATGYVSLVTTGSQ